jgi:hypothetical protein
MAIEVVNEDSTAYLTVTFLDKDGTAAVPSSASYRIDCLTNASEVKDDTVLTPASSIEITLSAADNAIITQTNAIERRLVTVFATYGASDGVKDEYEYNVQNMRKVPSPA